MSRGSRFVVIGVAASAATTAGAATYLVRGVTPANAALVHRYANGVALIDTASDLEYTRLVGDRVRALPPAIVTLNGLRLDRAAAAAQTSAESGLFVVRFPGPIDPAWTTALSATGAEILDYIPNFAYLVWLDTVGQVDRIARSEAVTEVARLPASLKMTPAIRAVTVGTHEVTTLLTVYRGRAIEATLSRLAGFGDVLWHEALLGQELIAITTASSRLVDLAADPAVISLSLWQPSAADGEVAKRVLDGSSGAGPGIAPPGYVAWLQSRGVSGAGVTVAVIDSGLDLADPSQHLMARVVRVSRGELAGTDGHGHHVAGIIGGDCRHAPDAEGYLIGVGVAPQVALLDIPRLRSGYLGSDREQVRDAVTTAGTNGVRATVASCSWNAGIGSDYTLLEREWDAFARDADDLAPGNQPLILSFSAGNAGAGRESLTRPHAGKNLITVGNSWSYRPALGRGDFHRIALTSSRGPTADGRIKPDVVAPGTDIASAYASPLNCNAPFIDAEHAYCTGTSMSQPHVAGAAALIVEAWQRGHAGAIPSPALVKAALVNGARDLPASQVGPPFSTESVPNFDEGWGLVDLGASLEPAAAVFYVDQTIVLDGTGERLVRELVVADPALPLKVTLSWTDAPGAVGANPALVNDLDLTLASATAVWHGNGFADGWSDASVSAADDRNNLENVFLERPVDDVYELEVFATNVPGDGVPGVGDATDQDFALVVANALLPREDGGARILGGVVRCGSRAELLVWDSGVSGPVLVEVASSTELAAEMVTLVAVSPGSKLFRGGIDVVAGAPLPDGRLQVRDGDTVELRYVDAVDGRGGFDVLKVATATVDCQAPVIRNVRATATSDRAAVIEWDTDELATSWVDILSPLPMTAANGALATSHRLELEGLEACTSYSYRVASTDPAGNRATDVNGGGGHWLRTLGRMAVFSTHFESDDGGFSHWGSFEEWEWGAPREGPSSALGDRLWGTDLDGKYAKGGRSPHNGNFLLVSPLIDLGGGGAWLRFRYWYDIATDGDTDDGAWVEAWSGGAWVPLLPRGGYDNTVDSDAPARADDSVEAWAGDTDGAWREAEFDLSTLTGPTRIKLHLFEEDSVLAGTTGFYVDDFEVFRFSSCDRAVVTASPTVVRCGASLAFEVVDGGLDRDPTLVESTLVLVASPTEPAGEAVVLVESASSSARFVGTIATVVGLAQADGVLQIADGEVVAVIYRDEDDGGGTSRVVHQSLNVDCTAPRLGGAGASAEDDRTSVVWWSDTPATSLVHFGPTASLGSTIEDRTLTRRHELLVTGLTSCSPYYFAVESQDVAGNVGRGDDAGQPFRFRTQALYGVAFRDDFERDQGWSLAGEWERGRPRGHHLVTPSTLEPNAAVSGTDVLGVDLSGLGANPGRYEALVVGESATSPPFDVSALPSPRLEFRRWLGVEQAPRDLALVEASANGGLNWSTLWSNPTTGDVNDRWWTPQSLDLVSIRGSNDARVRFTMNANAVTELMGFQLDDLAIVDPALPPFRACGSDLWIESSRVDDATGNADGMADPGETVLVPLGIVNRGTAVAAAIAVRAGSGRDDIGSLSRSLASVPDLVPGATLETLPPQLEVTISPCAEPGSVWPFQVVLEALDGASTRSFELVIGGATTLSATTSGAPPSAIPDADPSGIATAVEVFEAGLLTGLEIAVEVDHPDGGELILTMTTPRGETVTLHSATGLGTAYGPRRYPPTPIDGPRDFSSLIGQPVTGVWSLRAVDGRPGGVGTLTRWTLELTVAARPASTSQAAGVLELVRNGLNVVATWGAGVGAARYRLERSTSPRLLQPVTIADVSGSGAVDPAAVAAEPSWYYRVRGLDSCGREGP